MTRTIDDFFGVLLQGLEQVADAIEHMYAGKNTGKVTVTIPESK